MGVTPSIARVSIVDLCSKSVMGVRIDMKKEKFWMNGWIWLGILVSGLITLLMTFSEFPDLMNSIHAG